MRTEFRSQRLSPRFRGRIPASHQGAREPLQLRSDGTSLTSRVSLDSDPRTPACPSGCLSGFIKVERQLPPSAVRRASGEGGDRKG